MKKKLFIARQGIYDKNMNLIAYELLYRNSFKNYCINSKNITKKLIKNINTIGLKKIKHDKKIFINFDYNDILKFNKLKLNPDYCIIEILENVKLNTNLKEIIINLKKSGFLIALDDITDDNNLIKFKDLIDIFKIDFLLTNKEKRLSLIKKIKSLTTNSKILAEKISTCEELTEAKKLNFDYYQGFCLHTPEILTN